MAYYDALTAAWNNVTQPPPGVTGAALLGGDTTAQKIAKVNSWTVTGSVPTSTTFTGAQLANCINATEFFALVEAARMEILALCAIQGQLLGGSANTGFLPVGMILKYFPAGGPTILALTAFAQAAVQPWWQAPSGGGLTSPVNSYDCAKAGLV